MRLPNERNTMDRRDFAHDDFSEWAQNYLADHPDVRRIPTIKAICPSCGGEGRYVNPSIDSNGITADEMYELGDDFRDDYMSGVYDVECQECHGANVVDCLDETAPIRMQYSWADWERSVYEMRCERDAERRMGA
jgi:hypothetical protein